LSPYLVSCFRVSFVNRPAHTPQWFLLITALATGAVVMALEIVGSRLLAPVLRKLPVCLGGIDWSDSCCDEQRVCLWRLALGPVSGAQVLAGLLLFSGAWTFLIAWLGQPALFKVAGVFEDPRWGPCVAAALLLGPPAFGLSGVLPGSVAIGRVGP